MSGIRKIAKKEEAHGHERAEIEPNCDEGSTCVYERFSILGALIQRFRDGESIFCKRIQEVKDNSTNITPEIANILQKAQLSEEKLILISTRAHK
jgi:hypothetical protein